MKNERQIFNARVASRKGELQPQCSVFNWSPALQAGLMKRNQFYLRSPKSKRKH